jgi:Protein of unknown function (DUF3035)
MTSRCRVCRFGGWTELEIPMRYLSLLLIVMLAACSNDGLTRTFSLSRDNATDTVAASQMPLSMPPNLGIRPTRPGALATNRNALPPGEPATSSAGQDALVQSAGPAAASDIRMVINENSGLIYPDRSFVDRLMGWVPPAGYTPAIRQASGGGWFSHIF